MQAQPIYLGADADRAAVFQDDVAVDRVGIERPVQLLGAVVRQRAEHGAPAASAPWPTAWYSSISRCAMACTGTNRILPRLPWPRKCGPALTALQGRDELDFECCVAA